MTRFQTQTGNVDAGANGNHFSPSPEAKVGNEDMSIFDPGRKVGESKYGGRCLHDLDDIVGVGSRDRRTFWICAECGADPYTKGGV